jgi:protein gp37
MTAKKGVSTKYWKRASESRYERPELRDTNNKGEGMKNRIDIENSRYWDRAWSLVDGCTPCSPGCIRCWSAAMTDRFMPGFTILNKKPITFDGHIRTMEDRLSIPLKTRKPTVFAVWNDLFHEAVPREFIAKTLDATLDSYFEKGHTFLILTKRPQRMADEVLLWTHMRQITLSNVDGIYFGLTVCNQEETDEKLPEFLQVPGKKFLSIEPMLGPIKLFDCRTSCTSIHPYHTPSEEENLVHCYSCSVGEGNTGIDAVILGGETGPGARPVHPDWVRSLRDQCEDAGVPFFFKGWGEWVPSCDYYEEDDELRDQCLDFPHIIFTRSGHKWNLNNGQPPVGSWILHKIGNKHHARLLDGRTHDDLAWVK